ncbi:helix-turn-helix domain-containing protein [Roseomonas sp. NAR14]|uniref:Helix-turn-helix domain-containing protein n=1 Tax=Roseomonas acroporae TaxID=2937791 RepID=A0A9X1YFM2_9PROT|nr:helix-turn-helix transcriptional regulator [Roseomonas acroporae]MCK8787988.1 helix-turn-helix domain-containing protein [Roseomonas acroporae]
MSGAALRAALDRLGLSQEGGARLLGVDGRTMRRWVAEERDIPPPVIRLLWAMERDRTLVEALHGFKPAAAAAA